jgi:hypothetical protein
MRAGFAALAAVALVLSGCSGGTEKQAATTSRSPAAVTASPTSPPTPIAYGPATLVTGTDVFSVNEGTVTTDADGSSHSRNGGFHSTLICADKRVAGTQVATWSSDRWGTESSGALVQWGTARISNSGGGWIGRYTGVYTSETHDVITWWFTGTGGYKGLSMYMWEQTSTGFEAPFQALVFPGSPPTP